MKKTLREFLTGTTPKAPAVRPKTAPPTKRAIWRISERAPLGEWVDPDAWPEPPPPPEPDGQHSGAASSSWMVSSMDLLNGTDVSEDHETSPGELFDDANARRHPPKHD